MATTTWTETTADALSVTKAAVEGSSHFITGIHVVLVSDADTSDVPEAATITLQAGGTTILNSGIISNTDDQSGYYPWGGFPVVNISFPHPIKVKAGGSVVLTVAGVSASLSGDVDKKLTILGYTEVEAAARAPVSDGEWWRG